MSRFQLVSSVDGAMKKPVSPSRDLQTHTEERGRFCCFFVFLLRLLLQRSKHLCDLFGKQSLTRRPRERERGPREEKVPLWWTRREEKKNTIHGAAFGSGERKPSAPSHETPTWRWFRNGWKYSWEGKGKESGVGGEEYKDRKRKKTEISSSFMAIMYYASKRRKKKCEPPVVPVWQHSRNVIVMTVVTARKKKKKTKRGSSSREKLLASFYLYRAHPINVYRFIRKHVVFSLELCPGFSFL